MQIRWTGLHGVCLILTMTDELQHSQEDYLLHQALSLRLCKIYHLPSTIKRRAECQVQAQQERC